MSAEKLEPPWSAPAESRSDRDDDGAFDPARRGLRRGQLTTGGGVAALISRAVAACLCPVSALAGAPTKSVVATALCHSAPHRAATCVRAPVECGGKRSATPLWAPKPPANTRTGAHALAGESVVAAPVCHRAPKTRAYRPPPIRSERVERNHRVTNRNVRDQNRGRNSGPRSAAHPTLCRGINCGFICICSCGYPGPRRASRAFVSIPAPC